MVEVLTGRAVQQEVEAKRWEAAGAGGSTELVHTKNVQTRYLHTLDAGSIFRRAAFAELCQRM